MTSDVAPDGRDTLSGRLLPGHSVRPLKRGGPSRAEVVALYLEPHAREILDRALQLAKQGDPHSMKLILERLAPIPKGDAERVQVPGLRDAASFAEKCHAVIAAVSDGSISAEAGERVLRLLDVFRRAHETDALEARIAAIEASRVKPTVEMLDAAPASGSADAADGLDDLV